MKYPASIFSEYRKWYKNWDDLCARCGRCCYAKSYESDGTVVHDYTDPCQFLDEETKLCTVFETRYEKNEQCGSVNLFRALFSPLLPAGCAYAKAFRGDQTDELESEDE